MTAVEKITAADRRRPDLASTVLHSGGTAFATGESIEVLAMLRLGRLAAAALSALAFTGCATMSVSSHFERGLDFSKYRTYEWAPPDALPIGDPRLDSNPFFHDYFQGAVEKE